MGGAGKIFESFLDIIIFLFVSSSMCVYLYLYFDTSMSDKVRESMSGNVSSYPVEFGQILDWHEIMQILLVVANILVFFRILMFSALLDAVHEIVKAILKALSSMTTFLLLVLVRVLCLSLCVYYLSLTQTTTTDTCTHHVIRWNVPFRRSQHGFQNLRQRVLDTMETDRRGHECHVHCSRVSRARTDFCDCVFLHVQHDHSKHRSGIFCGSMDTCRS